VGVGVEVRFPHLAEQNRGRGRHTQNRSRRIQVASEKIGGKDPAGCIKRERTEMLNLGAIRQVRSSGCPLLKPSKAGPSRIGRTNCSI